MTTDPSSSGSTVSSIGILALLNVAGAVVAVVNTILLAHFFGTQLALDVGMLGIIERQEWG